MHLLASELMAQSGALMTHRQVNYFAIHSLNSPVFFEDAEPYDCALHTAAETSHERLMHTDAMMS